MHLDGLNAGSAEAFAAALGEIFEHTPWIAARAAGARPFATVSALHEAMMAALAAAGPDETLALIRAHPELGGKVARAGEMAAASRREQGALGLDRLSDAEFARFEAMRDSILAQFARRLAHDRDAEIAAALAEIGHITRLRIAAAVEGPGQPKTDGRLSTHVLDTAAGRPAAGVKLVLSEIGASAQSVLKETLTNADGRTDEPLIGGEPLRIGRYEIAFHIGDYFASRGLTTADPPFLDVVPVRFAIAEPEGHYHVPLLATPWSYSTYRGS
jgi:2-oxo-4-hydroxy-4-carboxy-5-ureidoimidazoline decarboxylase